MKETKHVNLKLDNTMYNYLAETAWKNRTNKAQYIRDLLQKEMNAISEPPDRTNKQVSDYDGF